MSRYDGPYALETPGEGLPALGKVWHSDGRVVFRCPCGGDCYCALPVAPRTGTPRWSFDPATVSLTPSVLHLSGCKSHFFLTNGFVDWR